MPNGMANVYNIVIIINVHNAIIPPHTRAGIKTGLISFHARSKHQIDAPQKACFYLDTEAKKKLTTQQ